MNLCALTVSVGCGGELQRTLPGNVAACGRAVVVTTSDDELSQAVARKHGARLVVSDACYADGAAFNKGNLLTAGVRAAFAEGPSWLVFTDADCFLPPDLPERLRPRVSTGHFYYGSRRHLPPDAERYDLGRVTDQHRDDPCGNDGPWGYFQLVYGPDLESRLLPGPAFPSCFVSACGIDHWLMSRWGDDRRIQLPVTVLHLYHGPLGGRWNGGRVPAPGLWVHAGQSCDGEANLAARWPRPCTVRRTHLETCEQDTARLPVGAARPAWRSRRSAPYEYAVRAD